MNIKHIPAALVLTASLAMMLSSSLIAEEQKQDDKKGGNKQSAAAAPHAPAPQRQQVQRQEAPRAAAPQRQVVRQQATPRAISQQVNAAPRGNAQNSKHGNPASFQQAQVSHVASQNVRSKSVTAANNVSQNSQSGVSEKQNHRNRVNSSQVVSSQQGVNGAVRSPRQLSGGGASRAQSVNNSGGARQYQVTPNAQYNGNNNYGGLWTQANTHSDWSHDGQHSWNNHNYRWYQGGWLIIDGLFNPFYSNGNVGYSNGGYNGSSMASSVQSRLNQLGYYNGPIDGDLGPGSRNAIANFQRDNNLYVNGRITNDLLQSLQLL